MRSGTTNLSAIPGLRQAIAGVPAPRLEKAHIPEGIIEELTTEQRGRTHETLKTVTPARGGRTKEEMPVYADYGDGIKRDEE